MAAAAVAAAAAPVAAAPAPRRAASSTCPGYAPGAGRLAAGHTLGMPTAVLHAQTSAFCGWRQPTAARCCALAERVLPAAGLRPRRRLPLRARAEPCRGDAAPRGARRRRQRRAGRAGIARWRAHAQLWLGSSSAVSAAGACGRCPGPAAPLTTATCLSGVPRLWSRRVCWVMLLQAPCVPVCNVA